MRALFKNPRARRPSDFYPTLDPNAVRALCPVLGWGEPANGWWPADVWEPAAGEGHMARALRVEGFDVVETDLEEYEGGGLGGLDFLAFKKPLARSIITNPPFSLAVEFIEHSFALGIEYLALLLKTDFWCAAKRTALYNAHTPTQIAFLNWKVDFTGEGAPPMTMSWHIWTPDPPRAPIVIRRPS